MRKSRLADPSRQPARFDREFEQRVEKVAAEARRLGRLPVDDEPHADWVQKLQREYQRLPEVRDTRRARHVATTVPHWQWTTPHHEIWHRRYRELQAHSEAMGSSRLPREALGVGLYCWVVAQRQAGREGRLDPDRHALLEALPGWTWRPSRSVRRSFLEREVGWLLANSIEESVTYGPTSLDTGTRVDLDVALPALRIAIEIDGRHWHAGHEARDLAKNAALERAGWTVIRVREYPLAALSDRDVVMARDPSPADVAHAVLARLVEHGVQTAGTDPQATTMDVDRRADFHSPWERMRAALDEYVAENGHAEVPIGHGADADRLGQWVAIQRRAYRQGRLSTERRRRLEAVAGWAWNLRDTTPVGWGVALERTAAHARRHGQPPSVRQCSDDGFRLGRWVSYQRTEFRAGRLSIERIRQLERIPGWWWQPGSEQRRIEG